MSESLKERILFVLAGNPCRCSELYSVLLLPYRTGDDLVHELVQEGRVRIDPDSVLHVIEPAPEPRKESIHYPVNSNVWLVLCPWTPTSTLFESKTMVFNDRTSTDISEVTCRECLEKLVGHGELAVARLVELDRDAGEEAVGGKCPHRSKFQCTWCDEHFCLDHVDGKWCGAKIVGWTGEIKTIAKQCRECYQIEQDVEEQSWNDNGCLVSHSPTGLAAFCSSEKSYWENKRVARERLRAAMGKLPEDYWQPRVVVRSPITVRDFTQRMQALNESRAAARAVLLDSLEDSPNGFVDGYGTEWCRGGCSRGGDGPACGRPGCSG